MPLEFMVPFWGDPTRLDETVASVLAQEDPDWTLTIVDDCYPDPSVAATYSAHPDPRVHYVCNERNLGITDNYRRCIELAKEEIVVLLGCDDLLTPIYTSAIKRAARRFERAAIIQPGVQVIDGSGAVVTPLADRVKRLVSPRPHRPMLFGGEEAAVSLLRADWLYWPSLAFRREALKRYDFRDGFAIIQDLAIVIDMLANGESLVLDPTVCFQYRRHEDSASSTTLLSGARFDGEQRYFTLAARQMREVGWNKAARAADHHWTSRLHALTLIPAALRQGDRQAVRMLLAHTVARRPRA